MSNGAPDSATGAPAPNAGLVGSAPTRDVRRKKMKTNMTVTKSAAFAVGVETELCKQAGLAAALTPGKSLVGGLVRKFKARKALKAMGVTSPESLAKKTEELRRGASRFARTKPYNQIRRWALEAGMVPKTAALSRAERIIAGHMLAGAGIGGAYGGLDRFDHSGRKPGESEARFKNRRLRQSLTAAMKGAGKGAGVGMLTGAVHSGKASELFENAVRQRASGLGL